LKKERKSLLGEIPKKGFLDTRHFFQAFATHYVKTMLDIFVRKLPSEQNAKKSCIDHQEKLYQHKSISEIRDTLKRKNATSEDKWLVLKSVGALIRVCHINRQPVS